MFLQVFQWMHKSRRVAGLDWLDSQFHIQQHRAYDFSIRSCFQILVRSVWTLGYEPKVLTAMEFSNLREGQGPWMLKWHTISHSTNTFEIDSRPDGHWEWNCWRSKGNGTGLELIGRELMIHIQPFNKWSLEIQPATAATALVTRMRPALEQHWELPRMRMEGRQHDLQLLHRHRDQLLEENKLMEERNKKDKRKEHALVWGKLQRLRAENAALRFRLTWTDVQPGQTDQNPDRQPSSGIGGSREVGELGSVNVIPTVKVTEDDEVLLNVQSLKFGYEVSKYDEESLTRPKWKNPRRTRTMNWRAASLRVVVAVAMEEMLHCKLLAKMMEGMTNLQWTTKGNHNQFEDNKNYLHWRLDQRQQGQLIFLTGLQ